MADIDLADLDAFTAVARQRSFRGAAVTRGVSASTLSEAVRRLEARLGVRLLNRTTRSVTTTEAGARLLDRLTPALGEVQAALDVVNSFRDSPTGTLRLNVPGIVARVVMPPIVESFLKSHPGITMEVVSDDSFIDVLAAGFDAGVRYDERLEQDMIAVPIGPRVQRFATAAAPSYLASRGRPQHPRDLLNHACIRHRFPSRVIPNWEFERNGEIVRITPAGPLIATSIELEISAAVAGLGIVSSFEDYLAPQLTSGVLVPVLKDWWQSFSGPFLYYASRRHMPAPLRAFVDFIKTRNG
ncbi:LysR family transcriptional regulator [Pseudorhodoplanes sinuspersici]|uniref:LysR family transcriptional regulator n=1 Tax=Pseudorhodoplanes sinuspersici TaxID=1235591 RepID=A0A1W7A0U7_9HYPH|nr:LysR family transcriptional regulator [Pseudorhodoplanes sinuspersici]ARQ03213.1 LysR family transcriptional regulator [Pseudorhodoplanes sinuspersici]RKE74006.1 LysR family transcriptional regulator [Pseudorhodoplanes sinuspersici]